MKKILITLLLCMPLIFGIAKNTIVHANASEAACNQNCISNGNSGNHPPVPTED